MRGGGGAALSLFVGCLTSQQHASVSHGRVCSDNFTCCHTERQAADQTFHLTQSQYSDTGPASPSADPITPGATGVPMFKSLVWFGPEKSRRMQDPNSGSSALEADALTTRSTRWCVGSKVGVTRCAEERGQIRCRSGVGRTWLSVTTRRRQRCRVVTSCCSHPGPSPLLRRCMPQQQPSLVLLLLFVVVCLKLFVVCLKLFVVCLKSQQSGPKEQICSENCTCCLTGIEVADQTFYLTQSQCTGTGPTTPKADRMTPGVWQG